MKSGPPQGNKNVKGGHLGHLHVGGTMHDMHQKTLYMIASWLALASGPHRQGHTGEPWQDAQCPSNLHGENIATKPKRRRCHAHATRQQQHTNLRAQARPMPLSHRPLTLHMPHPHACSTPPCCRAGACTTEAPASRTTKPLPDALPTPTRAPAALAASTSTDNSACMHTWAAQPGQCW